MDDDEGSSELPWPVAARETSLEADVWRVAERDCYRELLVAVQAATRFGERMKQVPDAVVERFAIDTVSAVLRSEGSWVGADQIALYRTLRIASGDQAQVLARASWAVRRLLAETHPGRDGLHEFLGRVEVDAPRQVPGEDRPLGVELVAISDQWGHALEGLADCHALTRAAFGFAYWRAEGITPFEELLEPTVAALVTGAGGLASFLPLVQGHRLDRHSLQPGAAARLKVFYRAVEAGALAALLELDRLVAWRAQALDSIADLSGRTPPLMVEAFLRAKVVSADWLASEIGCSPVSARRNLKILEDRGLVREVTGQGRYRFWTVVR